MSVAVIAASAIGGFVIGAVPTTSPVQVRSAAVGLDVASLYNAAQQKFSAGDVSGGLAALKQAVVVAPADGQSLALQAVWSDQVDDGATKSAALTRLSLVNPLLATGARNIISAVTDAAAIVPAATPTSVSGNPAIVVLGFGLSPKGKMAPELVKRLEAGKAQALAMPSAPVVLTGGKPQNGVTEAGAMRKWMISNGIDASRIVTEEKSVSTVSNAQNTRAILATRGVSTIVLVTSPNHIRRAAADFGATGLRVVGAVTTPTDLSKYAQPLSKTQQTGIRVEATRTAGLPASRQAVLPNEELPDPGSGLLGEWGGKILGQLWDSGSDVISGTG